MNGCQLAQYFSYLQYDLAIQLHMSNEKLHWWQIWKSVGAAFFGVQSKENHQQDFDKGRPIQFIVVGAIAAIIFVLALVLAVNLVIPA